MLRNWGLEEHGAAHPILVVELALAICKLARTTARARVGLGAADGGVWVVRRGIGAFVGMGVCATKGVPEKTF